MSFNSLLNDLITFKAAPTTWTQQEILARQPGVSKEYIKLLNWIVVWTKEVSGAQVQITHKNRTLITSRNKRV